MSASSARIRLVSPPEGEAQARDVAATLSEGAHVCPNCGGSYPADFVLCPRDGSPLGVARGETDPLIGAVVGSSYRVERRIAEGGMGRLYQGVHTRLPRKVAIKVLHEPHARRPEAVRRFEREASALARLDHPHVVAILDFLRTPDGRGAIVTPLLEGESLEARLQREGTIDEDEAVRVAIQICDGVKSAHREGIVHRDLKPSNIFLQSGPDGEPSRVKLLDFGVAKLSGDDMTRAGVVLGTPAYMAPEQAKRSADVDARADVYAIGAVLYRMLSGAPPFEGADAASVLGALLAGPPRRLGARRAVREGLEAIVERAMARAPEERYATVGELMRALERLGATAAPSAPPKQIEPSASRSYAVPRERAWAALAILGASALSVAHFAVGVRLVGALLEVADEPALALTFAIELVGSVAIAIACALGLSREARDRMESATELRLLRARIERAARVDAILLGGALLSLLTLDAWSDATALATLAAGALAATIAWLVPLGRG